ncbi:MAG: type I 3-dehydroquinate dehydratase [Candidatus Bathyarchaeota archaeon]|nr:MAG: type I 3-dehydroquinate dehydratase [Candidatus Bathyarchaeota archaeon]
MLTIRVCVAIPPKTVDEAIELLQTADSLHADLIEIRLDSLKNHGCLKEIVSCTKTPLIATNKSTKQHGNFMGTETERQKILVDAAKNGFEYVDVDLGTPNQVQLIQSLHAAAAKVIVSFHDFKQTPSVSELRKVQDEISALGADVCKIITTAETVEDNLVVLDFVSKSSKQSKIVCFAMGDYGKPSRLLSPVFGAFFTFACLDEKRKTAKGQLTIHEMNLAYETLGLK